MNKIYRLIWSRKLHDFVAVSESSKAQGKQSATRGGVVGTIRHASIGGALASLLLIASPFFAQSAFAGAGIFINDGRDSGCTLITDEQYNLPTGTTANGTTTSFGTNSKLRNIVSNALCLSGDKASQTNRALFYSDADAGATAASTSLSLGGELYVNGGNLGLGGGQTGAAANSMRIGSTATLNGVSGTRSLAIGGGNGPTIASGTDSIAVGTGATANTTSAVALGTGATAGDGQSVALGSGSTTAAAVGTAGTMIAGNAYSFAGANPDSTVSVGVAGSERTITNAAAGRLSATSTDAINGSQLYATNQALELLDGSVRNVANDALMWDPAANSGAGAYSARHGASGSNKIADVAAGTDPTDAVNVDQLNTAVSQPITFAGNTGSTPRKLGETMTITGAATTPGTYSGANLNTLVDANGNMNLQMADSPKFGTVTINDGGNGKITGVADGTDGSDAVNKSQLDAVSTVANAGWNIRANQGQSDNIGPDETLAVVDGSNTTASYDPTTKSLKIDVSTDPVFNSVTTGNTVINNEGVAITGGPSMTAGGFDAAGRKITNVADGDVSANSMDAVNGSQLYAINSTINNINTGGGIRYFHANSSLPDSQAIGANSVAVGGSATASGESAMALGANAVANADNAVALGAGSTADRNNTVSVGSAGSERQITNVAAGTADTDAVNVSQLKNAGLVNSDGSTNTAVTYNTNPDGSTDYGNVTLNGGSGGTQIHNVAAGDDGTDAVNVNQLNNALSVINNSMVNASNPMFTADGNRQTEAASAKGVHSTAMGANAAANADNSVALGAGSVADRANTVSVGSPGSERQIANVAAGTQGTDAVNVNQLNLQGAQSRQYTDQQIGGVRSAINDVGRNAYSGVAAATALSMIPDVDLGRTIAVGIGTANYRGYQATALGATARVTQNVKVRVGAGLSSGGSTVGIGASYQW